MGRSGSSGLHLPESGRGISSKTLYTVYKVFDLVRNDLCARKSTVQTKP